MEERSIEEILTAYRSKGLAAKMGFGVRPAVVAVDFIVGFTDDTSPLGTNFDREVAATVEGLAAARASGVSVIFITTAYGGDLSDGGLFLRKVPSLAVPTQGSRWVEVDPRLARRHTELLIEKKYASAFFGTALASTLTAAIDTVIVTGCTISGCVRATVVDALQHGFRPMCRALASVIGRRRRIARIFSISLASMATWWRSKM